MKARLKRIFFLMVIMVNVLLVKFQVYAMSQEVNSQNINENIQLLEVESTETTCVENHESSNSIKGWDYSNGSWYYQNADGSLAIGKQELADGIYYFSENGQMQTGWMTIAGNKYYFDSEGRAKTGWFALENNTYYAEKDGENKGVCQEGLTEVDGKNYYFGPGGSCNQESGWIKVDGRWHYFQKSVNYVDRYEKKIVYDDETQGCGLFTWDDGIRGYVNSEGKIEAGWKYINGNWYYFDSEGRAKTGWLKDGSKWYYLKPDGTMAKGKISLSDGMYYLNQSGEMLTGWKYIENDWYYFDSEGRAKTGWFTQGNSTYYAEKEGDNKGACQEGLTEIDGKKYYFKPGGSCNQESGWIKVDGRWHYFQKSVNYVDRYEKKIVYDDETQGCGLFTWDDGIRGYVNSEGKIESGWKCINGNWYYFDSEGRAKTGWLKDGSKWYYLKPDGTMSKGKLSLSDGMYYLNQSGEMLTGWKYIENDWYYFDLEGRAKTGWFNQGKSTYYAEKEGDNKGACQEGLTEIDGKNYYFRPGGSCSQESGWIKINERWHYFQKSVNCVDRYEKKIIYDDEIQGCGLFTWDDGIRGYVNSEGKIESGWKYINGNWYYFTVEGRAKTGWLKDGSKWYYLKPDGTMSKGKLSLSDGMYYLNQSGEMATGWNKIEGRWYYFDSEGRVKTGWFTQGNNTYYAEKDGVYKGMCKEGLTSIDGQKYYFQPNGLCNLRRGWIQTTNGWYYGDTSSGALYIGPKTVSGVSYLFNPDGLWIDEKLIAITNIEKTADSIKVEWNAIKGAAKYIIEYSKTGDFSDSETEIYTVTANNYLINNAENNIYYMRIKAVFLLSNNESTIEYESKYSRVECSVKEIESDGNDARNVTCDISQVSDAGIIVEFYAELDKRIKSADAFYYVVETEAYGNKIAVSNPLAKIEKNMVISEEIIFEITDIKAKLMDKFALAIRLDSGEYELISDTVCISNPETIASNKNKLFKGVSKKGLQGITYASYEKGTDIVDARNANTKQTLLNLDIASVVSATPKSGYTPYTYKGNTYYFSRLTDLQANVSSLNYGYKQYLYGHSDRTPVAVTLCLLLSYNSENSYLIDPAARVAGRSYYMLNVREEKARETLEALFLYLGEILGQENCYVSNWVLGNEINSSKAWNYSGNLDFDTYMECYATAFRLLYTGIKTTKTGNTVSVSLDNGWTVAPDTYAGKTTLDTFAKKIHAQNPNVEWSIAYHPYSYPLTRTDFWNDYSNTTDNLSTKYISMRNISVLTNYAAALENTYGLSSGSIRVLLTEQGYSYTGGAQNQASAIARGYYIAEFNDRIDAFIIRAVVDDPDEAQGKLYFGLMNSQHEKRIAFYVYEHMDSDIDQFKNISPIGYVSSENYDKFSEAKRIVCNTNWSNIVPGFDKTKLANIH